MTRKFFSSIAYIISAVCIAAAVIAVFASYILRDLTHYAQLTLKQIEQSTGYRITLDNIHWSIAQGAGITIDNLVITEHGMTAPLLKCAKVRVLSALFPLIKKRFVVSRVILSDPQFTFIRTPDAVWHFLSLPPPRANSGLHGPGVFDASVSLKRIIIDNARIVIRNDVLNRTDTFSDLSCTISFNRKARLYRIAGQTRTDDGAAPGTAAFEGTFAFTSAVKNLRNISGALSLSLQNMSLQPLVHMLPQQLALPDLLSIFDGKSSITLSPDYTLTAAGNLATKNLFFRQSDGSLESFGPCSVDFTASGDSQQQGTAALTCVLGDTVNFDSTITLRRSADNATFFDFSAAAPAFSIPALQQLITAHAPWKQRFSTVFDRLQEGKITLHSLRANGVLQDFMRGSLPRSTARLEIQDAFIRLTDTLPSLHSIAGIAELDNETIAGRFAARLFGSDNHTIDFSVHSLPHDPTAEIKITSALDALQLQELSNAFSGKFQNSLLSCTTGSAAADTLIRYHRGGMIRCTVDLTGVSYTLGGAIAKPAGIPNELNLLLTIPALPVPDAAPKPPVLFNFMLADSLLLTGTAATEGTPSVTGTYTVNLFDINSCTYPGLPASLTLSGLCSGAGSFSFPISAASRCPLNGSLFINNLSLYDVDNSTEIMGLSLSSVMTDTAVTLLRFSAHFGDTSGKLTGTLSSIAPLKGELTIVADLFDIDDFIKNVEHVQSRLRSERPAFDTAEPDPYNPFIHTALDMDFTVRKLNFMNWDFDNGTCRYGYKNGVMRWEDVSVTGGNGIINGFVVYDFADSSARSLILAPSRSAADFTWAVPGMRKKQTITGTMDLRGEFRSTFSRKSELGPNMEGAFHVRVTNGVIQKFTVLSNILSMLNISRIVKLRTADIFESGIPFDVITSDFVMAHAVMKTDNLMLRGPAMNLSAVGDINLMNDNVDLIVGAQILETIGKILGNIPIAGEFFTGKDKSLTIGYFHVKGPYQEASVTPMPVKSISGPILKIFRTIIDIPRELFSTTADNQTHTGQQPVSPDQ